MNEIPFIESINRLGEPRPIIVCLCGSTKFKEAFEKATMEEGLAGRIVLSVSSFPSTDGGRAQELVYGEGGAKSALDGLHKRKIELADEVLVLNVGGYIGESTRSEIEHAERLEKRIRYLDSSSVRWGSSAGSTSLDPAKRSSAGVSASASVAAGASESTILVAIHTARPSYLGNAIFALPPVVGDRLVFHRVIDFPNLDGAWRVVERFQVWDLDAYVGLRIVVEKDESVHPACWPVSRGATNSDPSSGSGDKRKNRACWPEPKISGLKVPEPAEPTEVAILVADVLREEMISPTGTKVTIGFEGVVDRIAEVFNRPGSVEDPASPILPQQLARLSDAELSKVLVSAPRQRARRLIVLSEHEGADVIGENPTAWRFASFDGLRWSSSGVERDYEAAAQCAGRCPHCGAARPHGSLDTCPGMPDDLPKARERR